VKRGAAPRHYGERQLAGLVMTIGIILGLTGTDDEIDLAGIGYVLFFLVATDYGVLVISPTRRHVMRKALSFSSACWGHLWC
jgi:hypothetical protein